MTGCLEGLYREGVEGIGLVGLEGIGFFEVFFWGYVYGAGGEVFEEGIESGNVIAVGMGKKDGFWGELVGA